MVPEYARILAGVVGAFLIVLDCISLVGTLIVPRPAGGRLRSGSTGSPTPGSS
jgi:hypothetical protein